MEGDGEQRGRGGDGGARGGEREQPPPQRRPPRRRARGPHLPAQRHLIRLGGERKPSLPVSPLQRSTAPLALRRRGQLDHGVARRCAGLFVSASRGRALPLFFSARACAQSPQRRGKAREVGGGFDGELRAMAFNTCLFWMDAAWVGLCLC